MSHVRKNLFMFFAVWLANYGQSHNSNTPWSHTPILTVSTVTMATGRWGLLQLTFFFFFFFFFWPSGRASSLYTSVHSYKTKACADALTVQTQLVINACIVFGLPKDTLTYPVWTHFTVVQETHSPEDNINMFSVFNTIWPLFPLYDFKITTMWFTSKSENWSQSHHFTFLLLSKPTKIY